jgi:hypothetical protein
MEALLHVRTTCSERQRVAGDGNTLAHVHAVCQLHKQAAPMAAEQAVLRNAHGSWC